MQHDFFTFLKRFWSQTFDHFLSNSNLSSSILIILSVTLAKSHSFWSNCDSAATILPLGAADHENCLSIPLTLNDMNLQSFNLSTLWKLQPCPMGPCSSLLRFPYTDDIHQTKLFDNLKSFWEGTQKAVSILLPTLSFRNWQLEWPWPMQTVCWCTILSDLFHVNASCCTRPSFKYLLIIFLAIIFRQSNNDRTIKSSIMVFTNI